MHRASAAIAAIALIALSGGAGPASEPAPYDLARSAAVVTSDPRRIEGTRAGRLDAFPAGDVYLTRPLPPGPDGGYAVPELDGVGCIGLEWAERRVLSRVSIELGPGAPPAGVIVQYWSSAGRQDSWGDIGQTPWQGRWERLPGRLEERDRRLTLEIDAGAVPEFRDASGTLKVRWLIPGKDPIIARRPGAIGTSRWDRAGIRCETDPPGRPIAIEVYNGELEGFSDGIAVVVHSRPGPRKADRTSLRFLAADPASPPGEPLFAVAVDDVLAGDGVWVKDHGVFLSRAEGGPTLDEYRRKNAGRKTVLARVHEMPEQTFDRAMAALRRPIQDDGPTLLSLAADDHKYIVGRSGEIIAKTTGERLRVTPSFGDRRTRIERLDWGRAGIDTAVVPAGVERGVPLRIRDRTYARGLGLHANSRFAIELDGRYGSFAAEVGVQHQGSDRGEVVFRALIDGEVRFDSGPLHQADAAKPIRLDLRGARRLVLDASTGPDITCAAADWAEARLLRPDGAVEYVGDLHAADLRIAGAMRRRLDGGWLPVPVNEVEDGGIRWSQRTFVAPLDDAARWRAFACRRPLLVAEFAVENTTGGEKPAALSVSIVPAAGPPLDAAAGTGRILFTRGSRVEAWADPRAAGPPGFVLEDGRLRLRGSLPAGASARLVVGVPGWDLAAGDFEREAAAIGPADRLRAAVDDYWRSMLATALEVRTPVPLLDDFIRSTQVHCLMAARPAEGRIAPWIAADAYGPLDTEAQAVILGMDLFGHHEFARRCHEFFVASHDAEGMLARGYTLMGTGQHLWTLAEHHRLTGDDGWLRGLAPRLLKACDWIRRQRAKTVPRATAGAGSAGGPPGERPECGLAPPGVLADWNRYAYYLYANSHYEAGLRGIATRLAAIGEPRAGEMLAAADDYRAAILRAYRWNQARMPVVPLRDGTWVPPAVSSLYTFGLTRDFFGGVSATGHDVEVGGNHLIPLGIIDPRGREADWIVDGLEDRWFLIDGIFGAYPAAENERDPFDRGGFAKLQPHYARTADIHALRDDVKAFIRTYFNTFPVLLDRENLTYWEHMNNGGAWDKTHESAWFLEMTRTMLVGERGGELWLAPFVPGGWNEPGKGVEVRRAPTRFGPVEYRIRPDDRGDSIDAEVRAPAHPELRRVVLRLRHPEGKRIREVTAGGRDHADFDPDLGVVRLPPDGGPIAVRARFR